jgi:hypothetical protein
MWGLSGLHTDEADAKHLVLLRARRERPRCRRAAEQRDEGTPFQLIELHSSILFEIIEIFAILFRL